MSLVTTHTEPPGFAEKKPWINSGKGLELLLALAKRKYHAPQHHSTTAVSLSWLLSTGTT